MSKIAQKLRPRNRGSRLGKRGIARFEVLGLKADRDVIRALAWHLAEAGPGPSPIRAAVDQLIATGTQRKGRILDALRRSPLARADLDLRRTRRTTGSANSEL